MCQWVVLCAPKSKRSGQLAHEKAAAHIRKVKQMMENSAASWKKTSLGSGGIAGEKPNSASAAEKRQSTNHRAWAMSQSISTAVPAVGDAAGPAAPAAAPACATGRQA